MISNFEVHIKNRMTIFLIFFLLSFFPSWLTNNQKETNKDKDSLYVEIQNILKDEFALWYPLTIDILYGGFFSDVNYKWKLEGSQNKMIVTQSRHIWSASNAFEFYENDSSLLNVAEHGFHFLKDKMWDHELGGFYDLVNRQGEPIKEKGRIIKRAYGNAFAIYSLAAYYKISHDTSALRLAKETFNWLEKHSYDPEYGGYFQFISREGIPLKKGYGINPPKDQNSSIHLLECFTELYKVWKDEKLKERLNSMLKIIRDTIVTDKGYMVLFFKSDWVPISYKDSSSELQKRNYVFDHISFGHDVETAYLLLEASDVLGIENDTTTLRIAKKMIDHALKNGWDKENGGLYDGGYYFDAEESSSIIRETKEWWSQAEALNSFLLMSELFPDDEINYFEKFLAQWDYIKKYLIDDKYGGWYWGGIDKEPDHKFTSKVSIWKCNYHTSRSLINCIRRLTKL